MKQSPLHEAHVKAGAQFGEVAGWNVPQHYGEPAAEYQAVRERVGVADLSHRGTARVTGEDRGKWLQSILSNDVLALTPGSGLYSGFLTHKGKMLSYFRVYLLQEAVLLEDVGDLGDATYQALRKFLLYGTKAKLEDCGETWGALLVSGPQAGDLVRESFEVDVGSLAPLSFRTREIGGQEALIIRTEETGGLDCEVLLPAPALAAAWERLWSVGPRFGLKPFGRQTHEVLRLEAGLPLAGAELTEDIVPPEANLEGKAFSLSKGCYPGQEVVARMDTYGSVRRRLVGLVLEPGPLPSRGAKLFSGAREVGWVTSAVQSPALAKPIALGFPLRDFSKPGTELTLDIGGERRPATVHPLPFIQTPKS